MKKIIIIISCCFLIYFSPQYLPTNLFSRIVAQNNNSDQILQNAFQQKISNLQVENQGIIIKILKDDLEGSRHQRFIIKLNSGQTVLIAHNIDLAPRVNNLKIGETIHFFGEYEWNKLGGVIHWTHKAPQGDHIDGWLKYKDKLYQ